MTKNVSQWPFVFKTALRSFMLGGNIASLKLVGNPRNWYSYCCAALLLRDTYFQLRGLPQQNVWEVFPQMDGAMQIDFPSLPNAWEWNDASFLADLVTIAGICRAIRPRVIFEIGTFKGYTALLFARNSSPDTRVFTLDLPKSNVLQTEDSLTVRDASLVKEGQSVRPCFDGTAEQVRITRLWGDSASYDFSPYYGSVDLFFVDGAHTYSYARKDTENALLCVRPGGAIAWHDYGRSGLSRGVTRWLDEFGRYCDIFCAPGSTVAYMNCTVANLNRALKFLSIRETTSEVACTL